LQVKALEHQIIKPKKPNNKKTPEKGSCGVGRNTTTQYSKTFQHLGGNIGGKNRQDAII
jgi:hypothetical protein